MTTPSPITPPPPAHGVRLAWGDVPAAVRADFEAWAGSMVLRADNQVGGFSPGAAARVQLADGRRLFVKAVGASQNPDAPVFARREAHVVQALPAHAPAPRCIWFYDQADWVVMVQEEITGTMPAQPWQIDELWRVVDAMDDLADALNGVHLPAHLARTASENVQNGINGWRKLLEAAPQQREGLDEWTLAHLEELAALEALAPAAVAGSSLLHFDIRADNVLLTEERVWFVDWAHACQGAPWVDLLAFAPSAAMNGGPPLETLVQRSRHARQANPADLTAFLAAIGGFFIQRGTLPAPPGLPTLRAFQTAQGRVCQQWLRERI